MLNQRLNGSVNCAKGKAPKRNWIWIASVFAILMVIFSYNAVAQVSTGDILGNVQDQTGAILPNATVTILCSETKLSRVMKSSDGGNYTFTLLPPGHYTVTVAAPGFKKFATNLALSGGDRARIDAQMTLGEASEKVEVTSALPALQADSSSLGAVVTEQAVQDLPLDGRNFVQLAQLAPGANEGPQNSIGSGSRPDDRRQSSSISVNGQPDLANNQMIDGIDNNDAILGVLGARPSVDAIAEFRVITSLYPAELGHTGGGVINLITKSGTTQFHGSAYEFFRNDVLDTRDFFTKASGSGASAKPEYRQNQFGGSVGGPLFTRTFFFGDYEALRIVQGQASTVTVPTVAEEQNPGDFSDIGGPVLKHLDPVGLNYFKLYPKPTNTTATVNNFTSSPKKTQSSSTFDIRADHSTKKGDSIFARETYNNVATDVPSLLPNVTVAGINVAPGGNIVGFSGPSTNIAHNAVLGYTHIFSPNLVGDFRAGYNRIYNKSDIPNTGKNVSEAFGLQGVNQTGLTGLTALTISGYAGLGDSIFIPIVDTSNTLQYAGSLSYIKSTHSFKAGASYIRRGGRIQQNAFGLGWDMFLGLSGNGLVDLLTGTSAVVQRSNQVVVPNLRTSEISEFAQDDWHVNKFLTVNLGVRYDIFTPLTETSSHLALFNPTTIAIDQAGVNGVSRSGNVNTDYSNLAPRVGFEISVTPKTVVRGGFGMSFAPYTQRVNGIGNVPYNFSYAPAFLTKALDDPFPAPTLMPTATSTLSGTLSAMDHNLKSQYIEQITLNVQQQIGSVVLTAGYTGALGHHIGRIDAIDAAPLTNSPNYLSMKPFAASLPNVTSISDVRSTGSSNYHALQLIAEKRTSNGLTLNSNYTYARNLGNVTAYSDNGLAQGNSMVTSLENKMDYDNSDLDVRQRFTLQINYELPFAKDRNGLVGALAKGWQTNAIDSWQTGTAFTVVDTLGQAYPGDPTDRPNQVAKLTGSRSIGSWFDLAPFRQQEYGTVGVLKTDNIGVLNGTVGPYAERRNQLFGPHYRRFDFSLFKNWKLMEKYTLQFRAEAFNLTNTPNFAQPNNSIIAWNADGTPSTAGGVGQISSTRLGTNPRQMQFALKLNF
jgi:hypothetical protein